MHSNKKNILNIEVSLFKPIQTIEGYIFGKTPENISIGDALGVNHQPELLNSIRSSSSLDEIKKLKSGLWMITPSAICTEGRSAKHIIRHSGLIQFDIDKIKGRTQEYLDFIKNIPYVAYCGLSASANGLWGLIPIQYLDKHKEHFDAMYKAFEDVGITIDKAPKAINSARYLAYDKDHYFNPNAKVFDKIIENKPVYYRQPISVNQFYDKSDSKFLVSWFNQNCTTQYMDEILMNFGFNFHSVKGVRYRYTRPNKDVSAGLSVDYHEDIKTLFSFSSEVPMLNYWKVEQMGWSCSPVTALLLYGCGGMNKNHWKTAFNYIKSKM